MPIGSSRRHVQAREVVILMTRTASHGVNAVPVWSAADLHCMSMTIVSLSRKISRGVTIHTARMAEHRDNCFESSSGAGIIARHRLVNQLRSGTYYCLHGSP
jgi:hypothetical protein